MTGPEHFREAETQLGIAGRADGGTDAERYALADEASRRNPRAEECPF